MPDGERWRVWSLAIAVTAAAGWSVAAGWPLFRADVIGSRARAEVQQWSVVGASWSSDDWERVRRDVVRALELTPDDASLHELMSALYALRGNVEWADGDPATSPGVALYRVAVQHQQRSLELRPRNAMAWAQMALLQYAIDESADAMWDAWRQARRLGPNEAEVRDLLVEVARRAWWVVPDDIRRDVETWTPGAGAMFDAEAASAAASSASAAQ